MTGKPVFLASAAHQIESAQFFDRLLNAEPTAGAVTSEGSGQQIPFIELDRYRPIRHPSRPDLVRVAPVRTPGDPLAPGGNFWRRGMCKRRGSFRVKRILTCCGILVSSEYQSTRTKIVLAAVESFRRACDRFPRFRHRSALPGRALLFLTPFFHSPNLVWGWQAWVLAVARRIDRVFHINDGIWPELSNPLQTIANWFAAHPV
jgi:hypothetical protein